jgi:hypothetical protein
LLSGNVRNPHQNPVGGQKTVHHLGKLIGDLQFAFQEIENHIAVGLALEQKFNTLGEIFAISFGFEQQGANVGAGYLPPEKIPAERRIFGQYFEIAVEGEYRLPADVEHAADGARPLTHGELQFVIGLGQKVPAAAGEICRHPENQRRRKYDIQQFPPGKVEYFEKGQAEYRKGQADDKADYAVS